MLRSAARRVWRRTPLERRACSSQDAPPLWPPAGSVGGPVYPVPPEQLPWRWRSEERERDAQGRAVAPRVGVAAASPPSVPLFDPRWAGPGNGGGETPDTASSSAAASTSASDVPDTPKRVPLSAASFSPERLRELGVGGLDAALQSLFRRAFASRATPASLAAQLGVTHVKGILLHGPPGTGKTLVARKLGTLLSNGREPRVVNGPELLARWVGASEENVRNLFAEAEADWKRRGDEADLHVIIFDEIDALCRARGGGGGGSGGAVGDSVVNQLLTKLDGVASAPNILVIGLTNRRDLLDEALLRPGRLEVQLEIGLPDEAGRADILRIHTRKMREAGLLACDVDVAALAARAKNFSGAELAGVVRAAASFAIERLLRPDHTDATQHGAHARGLGLGTVHVTCADFDAALLEVAPALGDRGARGCFGLAAQHAPRGILSTGPRVAALQAVLATLTRAASDGGDHTSPLVSALIHGLPGTGKTALAAAAADATGFPFARLVSASAEDAAGVTSAASGGGDALAGSISAAFADAYKSQRSVLVLDDLERLIGYSPVGPAYSNAALQALLVLLRCPPPHGRRMLVLGTSSNPDAMDALGISAAFGATIQVPPLEGNEVVAALLASRAFAHEHEALQAAALMDHRVPVKHLLRLLDMARHREEAVTEAPLTVAEFRDTVLHFQT